MGEDKQSAEVGCGCEGGQRINDREGERSIWQLLSSLRTFQRILELATAGRQLRRAISNPGGRLRGLRERADDSIEGVPEYARETKEMDVSLKYPENTRAKPTGKDGRLARSVETSTGRAVAAAAAVQAVGRPMKLADSKSNENYRFWAPATSGHEDGEGGPWTRAGL
uniref:Uncharacterized protein n=1 Tax=Plectus sambesii TaxID=2011161 RepID=A0A914UZW6_9BILA